MDGIVDDGVEWNYQFCAYLFVIVLSVLISPCSRSLQYLSLTDNVVIEILYNVEVVKSVFKCR